MAAKKNAGRYWQGSTIKLILSNPHYTGDLVQGRETTRSVTSDSRHRNSADQHIVVKNTHPPIITHSMFNTVQELLKTRKKNRTKEKKHLFTNVLYYSDCGTGMWYRQNRKGYICGFYARHGRIACTQRTLKEERIKEIVLLDLLKMVHDIHDAEYLERLLRESQKFENRLRKLILKTDSDITSAMTRKKRYLEMLVDKQITLE